MEVRKASDIIVEIDNKVDAILSILTSHDMLIKSICNKLNDIKESLNSESPTPNYTMEAVDAPSKNVIISSELALPEEKFPKPDRRTSRPSNAVPTPKEEPKPMEVADIIVSFPTENKKSPEQSQPQPAQSQNLIPVSQRVVNAQGKSQFMADVEILDSNLNSVFKGRTNGVGKWQASLSLGKYKINIRKIDALTKRPLESSETVIVDGVKSPLDLISVTLK